jgi:anti-sigma factor RsiW
MFDFWRNLTKSKAEKEREQLHAYVDNALSPAERVRFEARLVEDADLQAEVESLRQVKQMMAAVPRRRVPRNFTLDPAKYGRPALPPLLQAQPALRLATVLTAVIFIFVLALDWGIPSMPQTGVFEPQIVEDVALMEREFAITEVITEDMVEMEEVDIMEVEPAEEPLPAAEMAPLITDTTVTPETVDGETVATETMYEDAPAAPPEPGAEAVTEMATGTPTAAEVEETAVAAAIPTVAATPVTTPEPDRQPPPLTGLQWLQLGLAFLLSLFILLLFLARRQSAI